MTNNELLQDRLQKIRQIIKKYGEENFYISFSGGKDSTVLSALIDMALPDNKIPRVYANTGIEYKMIIDFVESLKLSDDRIIILKPQKSILQTLKEEGYPFKSKFHSKILREYQRSGKLRSVKVYLGEEGKTMGKNMCPEILKYQFTQEFNLKISPKCCDRLKKDPMHKWAKENNKLYYINGIMADEGGQLDTAKCLAFDGNKLKGFQPMAPMTKAWEDWIIEKYNIEICDIYKPPYNFLRTGCKGCPFALNLQEELNTLEKFFPGEYKQCEIIWAPIYKEYRRLNYRLKQFQQKTIKDFL